MHDYAKMKELFERFKKMATDMNVVVLLKTQAGPSVDQSHLLPKTDLIIIDYISELKGETI